MHDFTAQQLLDWKQYEGVRKSGKFNMFDPRARRATKLSGDEYLFVMRNYSALKQCVEESAAIVAGRDGGAV